MSRCWRWRGRDQLVVLGHVASKLKEASGKEKKFEDVVKEAEQAAVLVLVY